jgi:hypothetical protein
MDIDEREQEFPAPGNPPRVVLPHRPMTFGHALHAPFGLPQSVSSGISQPVPFGLPQPLASGLPQNTAVSLPARPPLPSEDQLETSERLAELEARRQAAIEGNIQHRADVAATATQVEWYNRQMRDLRGTRRGRSRSRSPRR